MAKPSKTAPSPMTVRMRRAYFDCSFGQLHVRTAFPGTGGFDELVPLFCLHAAQGSSRTFVRFLPQIADVRSVYAPDLPGSGESDPSPQATSVEAASAIFDLARDLRLRQIDVLGFQRGATVALELAAARADLVRRLVLISAPTADKLPSLKQPALILRTRHDGPEGVPRLKSALPQARIVEVSEYAEDLFEAAPLTLVKDIGTFLARP